MTEFYVSPEGNDSGKGTADDPFATIAAARDAVRAAKEGFRRRYSCISARRQVLSGEARFEFTAEDSGSDDCTITYKAYGWRDSGNRAVLSLLDGSKFSRPAEDDAICR